MLTLKQVIELITELTDDTLTDAQEWGVLEMLRDVGVPDSTVGTQLVNDTIDEYVQEQFLAHHINDHLISIL